VQARFDDPFPRAFYDRPVDEVAVDLLGCYLVRRERGRITGGRIVEVEAYGGPGDPGSHADRSPHGRARIMFGPPGRAYVYLTYGMHHCTNAVTDAEGKGSAVLVRALEPAWSLERMRRRTPTALPDRLLASGPGRLSRALGIDRRLNGADLVTSALRILPGPGAGEVVSTTRIGLGRDDGREWRFYEPGGSVSRTPRGRR
jgi:DNA-3-methyladenine glycosylase